MKTFMLLLHVWNAGGETSSFVIDYNMSYDDCAIVAYEWQQTIDNYSNVECVKEGKQDD